MGKVVNLSHWNKLCEEKREKQRQESNSFIKIYSGPMPATPHDTDESQLLATSELLYGDKKEFVAFETQRTGEAKYFIFRSSIGTLHLGTVGFSRCDLNMANTNFVAGGSGGIFLDYR